MACWREFGSAPDAYIIMAAHAAFFGMVSIFPALEGAAREAFIRQMSEIDPITHARIYPRSDLVPVWKR